MMTSDSRTEASGEKQEDRKMEGNGPTKSRHEKPLGTNLLQSVEQIRESMAKAAGEFFIRQKCVVVEKCDDISSLLEKIRESLQPDEQPQLLQAVELAGRKVQSLSDCVGSMEADRVLPQVRSAVQRNPLLLIGGSLALGFVIGRLLRASAKGSAEE